MKAQYGVGQTQKMPKLLPGTTNEDDTVVESMP